MSRPKQNKITSHKQSQIDPDSMESLRDAADTIFPDCVTLLSIRPYSDIIVADEILPWFDFPSDGSFVAYPKSRLMRSYDYDRFFVISLQSCYSLN